MKNPYILFSLIVATACLCSYCTKKNETEMLRGTWAVDSIFTYYNGFDFTRYDMANEPTYDFQPNNRVRFTIKDEFRYFHYELPHPDTLRFGDVNGKAMSTYAILKLTPKQLILREEKAPLFKQSNQQRYEVRYLSRTE